MSLDGDGAAAEPFDRCQDVVGGLGPPERLGVCIARIDVGGDGDAVWGAMLAGAGIACVPLWLVAISLRNGTAVELLAEWRDADASVAMLRRDRRVTPSRLTTLMAFLSARAPDLGDLL